MKRRIALFLILALMIPAYIWAWTAGGGSGTFSPTLTGNITISGGDLFLDSGRKFDFGGGNLTLIHSAAELALNAGSLLNLGGGTVANAVSAGLDIHVSAGVGGLGFTSWAADANNSLTYYRMSASSTVGTHAVVAINNRLSRFIYQGSDGTAFQDAAYFDVAIDGTPGGSGDMPGRFVFSTTPDGGASPVEALRIDSAQIGVWSTALSVGSATKLTVNAGEIAMNRMSASASAPGAAGAKLAFICGTNAGTLRLVAYAGTSSTGVTVVDNIGASATGC